MRQIFLTDATIMQGTLDRWLGPGTKARDQKVKGLFIHTGVVSDEEALRLVKWLDRDGGAAWEGQEITGMRRRVQRYGSIIFRYYTEPKQRDPCPIPEELRGLVEKASLLAGAEFDTVIVNEYTGEAGKNRIRMHIDNTYVFGPVVCSFSFLSQAPMIFMKGGGEAKVPLAPGSLAVLTGDARYKWCHGISNIKERRISVTLRTKKAASE